MSSNTVFSLFQRNWPTDIARKPLTYAGLLIFTQHVGVCAHTLEASLGVLALCRGVARWVCQICALIHIYRNKAQPLVCVCAWEDPMSLAPCGRPFLSMQLPPRFFLGIKNVSVQPCCLHAPCACESAAKHLRTGSVTRPVSPVPVARGPAVFLWLVVYLCH